MGTQDLKRDIEKALNNRNLCESLGRFGNDYLKARGAAYGNKDFELLRKEISAVKRRTAEKMDELVDRFSENSRGLGISVFRAAGAGDANKYILDLALDRGVKSIVKAKSMATEEIHLNDCLTGKGIEVTETDLGEWILQLAGQKPSHMVMPAIHMTRYEVAEVISREMGTPVDPDIPSMVKLVREKLRPKFLSAGMGITGANIAVAETGTVVICTNEGNGRLVTTLPPIHVVVMGMEKIVERFEDMLPILEALPRSATGQSATSYVTMITGPAAAPGPDGGPLKKEMHIVILDNGRRDMRRDPVFREAFQCIRCGSCLNVCPVYQVVGGHVFGEVYTGVIGTVLTAFLNSSEKAGDLQSLCLGCERCREVCPGKIDLPRLNSELRARMVEKKGLPFIQRLLFEKVLPNRKIFHGLLRAASLVQRPLLGGEGIIRHLPFFLSGLQEGRKLPAIAEQPFRDLIKERLNIQSAGSKESKGPRVGIFAGCLTDFVYPEIGLAMEEVLRHLGFSVVFAEGQTCCGFPAYQAGMPNAMRDAAARNISALAGGEIDYIVTPCPTCTHSLKSMYPELTGPGPEGREALKIAAKVRDITEFIYSLAPGLCLRSAGLKATYHDPCHLKRNLNVFMEPRELLKMAGMELVEMAGADNCCGLGGSYAVKFPGLSLPILKKKIESIGRTESQLVVTGCPGCLLHLRGGLMAENGEKTGAQHLVRVLADSMAESKSIREVK